MMSKEHGMISLSIVSILLIASLLFTLASSKQVYYQIKRAQNTILERQAFWNAEGGLECAFTELKQKNIKPTELTFSHTCSDLAPSSLLSINSLPATGDHTEYKLISHYNNNGSREEVRKTIGYGGGGVLSTIETSASVELTGSQHFVPNKTDNKASDGKYKCKSVVSGGTVNYVASVSGTDEHFFTLDSTTNSHGGGGLGAPTFECNSSYLSNLFDPAKPPSAFSISPVKGGDILENETVDVFNSLFNKDISEYASVREEIKNDAVGIVIGTNTSDKTSGGWVKNCHTKVDNAYKNGKRRIWIDGNCALTGSVFGTSIEANNNEAVQLIVFNGVLFTKTVSYFNGILYQYVNTTLNVQTAWENLFDETTEIGVLPGGFHKHDIVTLGYNNTPFVAEGSVYIDGGVGIDAIDRTIRINGSIIPSYNKGKVTKHSTQLKWEKGTWHDF
ncbi:hypothetical protein I3271_08325 [Photobacterium leiognathi]|uniref:hypothetical protein n=1 Tax=Photobacterium leiognathi TaxID=553611 RepID=UPI001EDCE3A9|nr:hypothetical protein [Photobacterium leiognathi]MCG3884693.1 hypothetical protein [Photobacterium leiognathi]